MKGRLAVRGKEEKLNSQTNETREIQSKNLFKVRPLTFKFQIVQLITIIAENGRWLARSSDIGEQQIWGTKCSCCPNLDYKKPFHFLISWKQWTGTTVSCTAIPALGLMTGKNLESPDCRLNFLPRPTVTQSQIQSMFFISCYWMDLVHNNMFEKMATIILLLMFCLIRFSS